LSHVAETLTTLIIKMSFYREGASPWHWGHGYGHLGIHACELLSSFQNLQVLDIPIRLCPDAFLPYHGYGSSESQRIPQHRDWKFRLPKASSDTCYYLTWDVSFNSIKPLQDILEARTRMFRLPSLF